MPKRLVDLKCANPDCGEEYHDVWMTSEEIEVVRECKSPCGKCESHVFIMLGRPQFSIRGEGVYDPGKH